MTEKQFTLKDYCIYEKGNPICLNLRDDCKRLNELYEENQRIKTIINEAYNTERTKIGQNVLKQIMEQL